MYCLVRTSTKTPLQNRNNCNLQCRDRTNRTTAHKSTEKNNHNIPQAQTIKNKQQVSPSFHQPQPTIPNFHYHQQELLNRNCGSAARSSNNSNRPFATPETVKLKHHCVIQHINARNTKINLLVICSRNRENIHIAEHDLQHGSASNTLCPSLWL